MAKDIPYDQKYYDPEIECMPRPELEALQLERLKDMVAYAYDNTVYYKRAFDEAGVKPGDIESLDDIAKFPFCDKKTERETQHVAASSVRCAPCPRKRSSSWPPRPARRACPRSAPSRRRTSTYGRTPRLVCSGRRACARTTATCTA